MTNAEFLPFGILSERSELLVRVKERHQSTLALERLSSPRAHSDTIGAGISARVSGRPFPDCLLPEHCGLLRPAMGFPPRSASGAARSDVNRPPLFPIKIPGELED